MYHRRGDSRIARGKDTANRSGDGYQSRRSDSLLLWEKGDREAVDEELVEIQDTSSVSLRLPPSPAGEGLGYAPPKRRGISFG